MSNANHIACLINKGDGGLGLALATLVISGIVAAGANAESSAIIEKAVVGGTQLSSKDYTQGKKVMQMGTCDEEEKVEAVTRMFNKNEFSIPLRRQFQEEFNSFGKQANLRKTTTLF